MNLYCSTSKNISENKITTNPNSVTNKYIAYPDKTSKRQAEGGLRLQNKYKHSIENKPLVTIITVVFNNEKTLERTILSVLNQTYDNIEYIIIDGASKDSTLDIIKKYEDHVDYYVSEPDDGIYYAMNKGLELASGEYILMLNSDDWFYEYGLSAIFNCKNKKYKDIISATTKISDSQNKIIKTIFPKFFSDGIYFTVGIVHQSALYSAKLHNEIGYYNTEYTIAADWDFILSVYDKYGNDKISLSYTLLSYQSNNGVSSSPTEESHERHVSDRHNIIKKYFPELSDDDIICLREVFWGDISSVYEHFSKHRESRFSTKFKNALYDFLIIKSDIPYSNRDNIEKPFYEYSTKSGSIEKLKTLLPLDVPYQDNENKVVIMLSSDRNYESYLWVTLSSLIDCSSSNINYYIYVLDGGITYKNNFYDLISNKDNFKIYFIDMRDHFKKINQNRSVSRGNVTNAGYYRLAVYHLFEHFDRVLYIDSDSYILKDVSHLYNIDMDIYSIAADIDSIHWQKGASFNFEFEDFNGSNREYLTEHLGQSEERVKKHFVSGVLVFNLKKTNSHQKKEKLYKLLEKNYHTHDQDILNLLYSEEEIKIFDRQWDYWNISTFFPESEYAQVDEMENYYNMKVAPSIVSYIIKPLKYFTVNCDYSDLFWNKIKISPYIYEASLILEIDKLKNKTKQQNKRRLTFLEYIFSVYTKERFVEIMIFGIKISIRRKKH